MTWRSTFFKSLPKARFFPVIGFPHRKHMPPVAARRPNHDHHSSAQRSHGNNPRLAIITAFVRNVQGFAANTSAASAKSRLWSLSVLARFAGSNVIFIDLL
jgi:hypothetical protein